MKNSSKYLIGGLALLAGLFFYKFVEKNLSFDEFNFELKEEDLFL